MSVRVVARVRPLLKTERELDVIIRTGTSTYPTNSSRNTNAEDSVLLNKRKKKGGDDIRRDNIVRIPNPKNEKEEYSFQFSAVYDATAGQQDIFDTEGEDLELGMFRLAVVVFWTNVS